MLSCSSDDRLTTIILPSDLNPPELRRLSFSRRHSGRESPMDYPDTKDYELRINSLPVMYVQSDHQHYTLPNRFLTDHSLKSEPHSAIRRALPQHRDNAHKLSAQAHPIFQKSQIMANQSYLP